MFKLLSRYHHNQGIGSAVWVLSLTHPPLKVYPFSKTEAVRVRVRVSVLLCR